MIVFEAMSRAVSVNIRGIGISPTVVVLDETPARQVLTGLPEDAAVFEIVPAEDDGAQGGDVLLRCERDGAAYYLTAEESGEGLSFETQAQPCSRWRFEGSSFLYSPNTYRVSGEDIYRNYYLEYYAAENRFAAFGKTDGNAEHFMFGFYRLGDSDPGDPLPDTQYYTLPVFETSDVHGCLADSTGEDVKYLLSYISDKVKDIRGYGENARKDLAVLLDGGDIFQGNTASYLLGGNPVSAAYRIMDYDAVTVGNHDFDWGIESTVDPDGTMMDYRVGSFVGENTVPIIVSNLYRDDRPEFFAGAYTILEKTALDDQGDELPVRVCVIGFAGSYAESILYDRFSGAGYRILPDYEAVNRIAAELEENGSADVTIVLTHEAASVVAEHLGEDSAVDLVLGGHTHRNENGLTDWKLRYMEPAGYGAAYAYARLAFVPEDGGARFQRVRDAVIISTAESASKMTWSAQNTENAEELDPELLALTDETLARVSDVLQQKIGYITESVYRHSYLPGSGDRSSTCGNWTSSIIARIAGADVAFMNNAGMRAEFEIGRGQDRREITVSDIYTLFPFDNEVLCFEISYEDLLTALSYSLTRVGGILLSQMSGVDCYYTDETVNAIVLPDGQAVYANGEWADGWKDRTLLVGVNSYVATTNRTAGDQPNPFYVWKDTPRLIRRGLPENEAAVALLTEEAAENGGHLSVDTDPHYLCCTYDGGV